MVNKSRNHIKDGRFRVLNQIWNSPGTHRMELAQNLDLNPNRVSDAVRALMADGWVTEGAHKATPAGRAPVSLFVDPQKRLALAVGYTPHVMTGALVNAKGEIVHTIERRHAAKTPEQVVVLSAELLEGMKNACKGTIVGVGVADPGMVDRANSEVVRSSSFPGWRHVPMGRLFEKKLGLLALVTDVTHARAMAQYRCLAPTADERGAMLYLDYGTGIVGFALVTPSGIWHGHGFAGEIAHVLIQDSGTLCRCGARGCLESLVGSLVVETRAKSLLKQGVDSLLRAKDEPSAEEVFAAALQGDRLAQTIVKEVAAQLGLQLAVVVAAFHPKHVVVGSPCEAAIKCLTPELRLAVVNRVPPEIASTIEVIEGKVSTALGLSGAGLMLFERAIRQVGWSVPAGKIDQSMN